MTVFAGLSAFPLTPVLDGHLDEAALSRLVTHLTHSGVDSLGVLGSTGSYPYLPREERRRAALTAVQASDGVPVVVGVGALSTREVLTNTEDAAAAGAAGVLLAPVSYQRLTEEEVYGLYADVSARFDVPVVVYDNPATTGFVFTDALHGRIAHLPHVVSVKIPPVADDPVQAQQQVTALRALLPPHVTIGVSGDATGANGLLAGCDGWYSVLAGIWPRTCAQITRAALAGERAQANELAHEMGPIWSLFARFGSYRTASAIAAETGLLAGDSVHAPVLPLQGADRAAVRAALHGIGERA